MLTAGFGVWLLFPVRGACGPPLDCIQDMASEAAWGGLFLSNGTHCVIGWRWTGRAGGRQSCASGLRSWRGASTCSGARASRPYDPASTGVFTYGALSLGSWACCVFAWRDPLSAVRITSCCHRSRPSFPAAIGGLTGDQAV